MLQADSQHSIWSETQGKQLHAHSLSGRYHVDAVPGLLESSSWEYGASIATGGSEVSLHRQMTLYTGIVINHMTYTDVVVLKVCTVLLTQTAADELSSIEASGASRNTELCDPPPRNKVRAIIIRLACCLYACVHVHGCMHGSCSVYWCVHGLLHCCPTSNRS